MQLSRRTSCKVQSEVGVLVIIFSNETNYFLETLEPSKSLYNRPTGGVRVAFRSAFKENIFCSAPFPVILSIFRQEVP